MESKKLKELREKRDKASERLKKACYECSPMHRKSEFVTCHNCGSRYPKKYLFGSDDDFAYCLICGDIHSFYSATSIKRIENCKCKLKEIQELLEAEQKRFDKAHPNESRFTQSLAQVREEIEGLHEEYDDFDCENEFYRETDLGDSIKIEVSIGGDSREYVIMKEDGRIYD